jgi:hypothetical protein
MTKWCGLMFSDTPVVPMHEFLEKMVGADQHLRANVSILVTKPSLASGQRGGEVFYVEYLTLMLRFGPRFRFLRSLSHVSDPTSSHSLSQVNRSGAFQPWFFPELKPPEALVLLERAKDSSWLVRPSATPNFFTLHCKSDLPI